jgi:hypothetical protein
MCLPRARQADWRKSMGLLGLLKMASAIRQQPGKNTKQWHLVHQRSHSAMQLQFARLHEKRPAEDFSPADLILEIGLLVLWISNYHRTSTRLTNPSKVIVSNSWLNSRFWTPKI